MPKSLTSPELGFGPIEGQTYMNCTRQRDRITCPDSGFKKTRDYLRKIEITLFLNNTHYIIGYAGKPRAVAKHTYVWSEPPMNRILYYGEQHVMLHWDGFGIILGQPEADRMKRLQTTRNELIIAQARHYNNPATKLFEYPETVRLENIEAKIEQLYHTRNSRKITCPVPPMLPQYEGHALIEHISITQQTSNQIFRTH